MMVPGWMPKVAGRPPLGRPDIPRQDSDFFVPREGVTVFTAYNKYVF